MKLLRRRLRTTGAVSNALRNNVEPSVNRQRWLNASPKPGRGPTESLPPAQWLAEGANVDGMILNRLHAWHLLEPVETHQGNCDRDLIAALRTKGVLAYATMVSVPLKTVARR